MQIIEKPIDELILAPYNPRKKLQPGDKEYEKLKKSLQEFGCVDPIIWNQRTGRVVGGHQRLEVMRDLGQTHCQVSVVDLPDEKEKALNLALNKISGEWDNQALKNLLEELDSGSFDIEITGFDDSEIEELMSQFRPEEVDVEEDLFDEEEAVQEAAAKTITKAGDLWLLGNHRLLCGDSTCQEDIAKLMNGTQAKLIITDPPYNINYEGGTKKRTKIQNDSMDCSSFNQFLFKAFQGMFNASMPGCPIYVFHADIERVNFETAFRESGWKLSQCLVWVKNRITFGRSDYHWRHEPILYGWKEGASHFWYGKRKKNTAIEEEQMDINDQLDINKLNKKELADLLKELMSEKHQSTVIREDKPLNNDLHPTMKPLRLIGRLMQNSSEGKDVVVDPFGGSGSTLITAEQLGRTCYTMELDQIYCDVIVKRWEQFTGEKAILENR